MEIKPVSHADEHAGDHGTRRDFLYFATAGAGTVAAGAAAWTLINQMNPSADVQALSSIQVDISGVETGTQLTVKWLGKPVFIRRRTAEEIEKGRAVKLDELIDQSAENANKPDAVKQKMIEGKIKKYFKENCLVDQEFVKDGDMTVGQYTAKVAKDLGGDIKVIKFTHFVKGEGLEKRSDDFAAEVASMVK